MKAKLMFGQNSLRGSMLWVSLGALSSIGCGDTDDPLPIAALQRSGDVALVCRGPDGTGRPLDECPDFESGENSLYALVTQTVTGEVAVVDLTNQDIVDVNPSLPGITFLRVGAVPVDIVSTPGGQASFVGVAEVGRQGIFALPTSCAAPPKPGETVRDLTTWPACSLPSAPGEMRILIDPADENGSIRESCGSTASAELPEPLSASRTECAVDLREELLPPGRRKLAVALPELGQLAILDAQALLDREPGSFEPCSIEALHSLEVDLPDAPVEQSIPSDLNAPACMPETVSMGARPESFVSRPAGFALSEDTLYIADQSAPVVHVLDVSDPCAPTEQAPLLPTSYNEPERVVTTSRVAVTPLTSSGQRFVYAIDELSEPVSSLMVFDVSPGSAQRTPLVRPGSTFMPFEAPDRILLGGAVKDITFGLRDLAVPDPVTGVSVIGQQCNPDPAVDPSRPAARYRPSSDLESGAAPNKLRGIFGFALLSSGRVSVIDVDDFDAACRRPTTTNSSLISDFRGCVADPARPDFYTIDGQADSLPTVTDEISCRAVEPHRARSANFITTRSDVGIGAPTLRSFPQLSFEGRGQPTDQSPLGKTKPKLLAVEYPNPSSGEEPLPVEVFVGNGLLSSAGEPGTLDIDPATAERLSVALPYVEPRAYPVDEEFTVAYEGAITGTLPSGFLRLSDGASPNLVEDQAAKFCSLGVQGVRLTRELGQQHFGLTGDRLAQFAERHADYVQVTETLLEEDHSYWDSAEGQSCGGAGFVACDLRFGGTDPEDFGPERELRIIDAYQDHLVVEPRVFRSEQDKQEQLALLNCCFPGGLRYTLRAGRQWVRRGAVTGFQHDIVAARREADDGSVSFPCVRDCRPTKRFLKGRAFEISSNTCTIPAGDAEPNCAVGPATAEDLVCVYDGESGPVRPGGPASECIHDALSARFAVYRGLEPSQRGMVFRYQVVGAFAPLSIGLGGRDSSDVLPQEIRFIQQTRQLAVVDAESRGLVLLNLDTLQPEEGGAFF